MTTYSTADELYRKALEAEGGEPVSVGARVSHVRAALESGRAFYVDLSGIPEAERLALITQIHELIKLAKKAAQTPKTDSATKPVA